ncbi:MAG TPA: phosphotransferase [Chryseolinea sp.]|nr:phosphotransferase [Chryseolinea sp.]
MSFPTIYSTLDPAALARHLSKQYALGRCSCQLLLRGVGDTYLVEAASGKSILRVYRNTHRTLEHIRAEVELLLALKEAGVSVSYPLVDRAGNAIQTFDAAEGARHAVLLSFAAGESIMKFSDAQLRGLGREMARFHMTSSSVTLHHRRWSLTLDTLFTDPIEKAKPYLTSLPDELTWWLHAIEKAREELNNFSADGFAVGYCHYDFLPKNFHFAGDQITLFDFDFFAHGWLVNDLMTFWTQLCLDVQFNRMTRTEADRSFSLLLDAYQMTRPISREELRAIPALSVGWWCFYMGFHTTHDQFTALVQPAHLKMRTALIRQLTEKSYESFRF